MPFVWWEIKRNIENSRGWSWSSYFRSNRKKSNDWSRGVRVEKRIPRFFLSCKTVHETFIARLLSDKRKKNSSSLFFDYLPRVCIRPNPFFFEIDFEKELLILNFSRNPSSVVVNDWLFQSFRPWFRRSKSERLRNRTIWFDSFPIAMRWSS